MVHSNNLSLWWRVVSFLLLILRSFALNSDGILLLSFKYSVLSDPLSVLNNWDYGDATPCSWNGVTCAQIGDPGRPESLRVTSLVLPNSQVLGSIPSDLGMVEYLNHLDLSNNFLNGSLPASIFNASELQVLSLSNNVISGELPESIGNLRNLQLLNLSENALDGKIPENLITLRNLTVVSLRSNYFSGSVPHGLSSVQFLDLSSNLLNGSLPIDFRGDSLNYLNLSYNKISGPIPYEFAHHVPQNSTVDLSFNNLTGPVPESAALLNQKAESLAGNANLCGKPLKTLCSIPSTLSKPPNVNGTSSPAIAAIPRTIGSTPVTNTAGSTSETKNESPRSSGLKPSTIAVITVADLAGMAVLAMVVVYLCQLRKKRIMKTTNITADLHKKSECISKPDPDSKTPALAWSCMKGEETSDATTSDSDIENNNIGVISGENRLQYQKGSTLVTVDGETKLELETLLKASAYILGSLGSSIVYKAVLEDGTSFAVRRIGECAIQRMKDFENQVRAIAKLRHPNLVKVRGFCWGKNEKLVIYDYVSNGNLTSNGYRRTGSSQCQFSLEARLKIAKGVAQGLAYIHDKKQVHGNIKPSNILLSSSMEALISDFGLDRLISTNIRTRANDSGRNLAQPRSQAPDPLTFPSPHSKMSSSTENPWPYHAPESFQSLKPNPKWDVYSFGIILLELLTGKGFSDRELSQWTGAGSLTEEKHRVLRMVDVSIRAEIETKEDAVVSCFKLGLSCASVVPQKRPSMKEALQILEQISSSR